MKADNSTFGRFKAGATDIVIDDVAAIAKEAGDAIMAMLIWSLRDHGDAVAAATLPMLRPRHAVAAAPRNRASISWMVLHKWGEGFGRRGGGNAVRLRLPSENGAHEERGRTSSGRDTQKHEPLLASGASAAHADAARRELGLLGAGLDGQDVLDVHGRVLVEQAVGAAHDVRAQVQQEAARRRDGPALDVGALVGVLVLSS